MLIYWMAWAIIWVVVRILTALLGGLRVEGAENIPQTGRVVIAPNHVSFADPPIIGMTVGRPVWYMATHELFQMRIAGPLAKLMRGFPVRQDSPDRAAIRFTESLLNREEAVVIFPEGHVSKDGVLQPILPGTIMMALRTETPIVPVGLIATDKAMPPHTFKLRHAKQNIIVRYGKPISPNELGGGLKGRAAIDHGAAVLRDAISELISRNGTVSVVSAPQMHLRDTGIAGYRKDEVL